MRSVVIKCWGGISCSILGKVELGSDDAEVDLCSYRSGKAEILKLCGEHIALAFTMDCVSQSLNLHVGA